VSPEPPQAEPKPKRWKLWLTLSLVAIGAIAALCFSRYLHGSTGSWISGVLANIGVTLLLVVPGALIVHSLGATLQGVRRQANSAQKIAIDTASGMDNLSKTVGDLVEGAEAIRKDLFQLQMGELDEELAPYKRMKKQSDRQSLLSALKQAIQTGLVSKSGLRSPIWWTEAHFRFSLSEAEGLIFTIEDHGGNVLSKHEWLPEVSPVSFFSELSAEAKKLGLHLGPQLFDPTESIQSAADALSYAVSEGAQKLNAAHGVLVGIREFVEGWFITDSGIVPKGHESYFIAKHRLWERDWAEHVNSTREWDEQNIHQALEVARALHFSENPKKIADPA
jgi:hypothetical protein